MSNLTPKQRRILDYLKSNPNRIHTIGYIADACGVSPSSVSGMVAAIRKAGYEIEYKRARGSYGIVSYRLRKPEKEEAHP